MSHIIIICLKKSFKKKTTTTTTQKKLGLGKLPSLKTHANIPG